MKSQRRRMFAGLILFSSLIGYMEWGDGQRTFLFQAEAEVFKKLFTDPMSVLHPLVLLPLAGQVLLAIALFQSEPSRKLVYVAVGMLALLLLLSLLAGLLSTNAGMIASALPFIIVSATFIAFSRRSAGTAQ